MNINLKGLQDGTDRDQCTSYRVKLLLGKRRTSSFKETGIKVWVLTGDKVQTAINIGYAAGLLNSDMDQFIIEEIHDVS